MKHGFLFYGRSFCRFIRLELALGSQYNLKLVSLCQDGPVGEPALVVKICGGHTSRLASGEGQHGILNDHLLSPCS